MAGLTNWVFRRYWPQRLHPYQLLRDRLAELVQPGMTVIDAGCGYHAPTLSELRGRGARLIGVDVVPLDVPEGLESVSANLAEVPLPDATADLLYSRSVMEHLTDPDAVYAEAWRLLKPGGRWIFLTANRWDYVSLAARIIPNRWHGRIISAIGEREEKDVFPTAYRTNDRRQISALAQRAGFEVQRFDRMVQYPSMLAWNGVLFLVGTAYEKLIARVEWLSPLRGWLFVELVKPEGSAETRIAAPAHAHAR
jgi:SAM-dependent methyltransferase